MPVGRVTCPLLWAAALGAALLYGVSLTTSGIAPPSLGYNPLTPVARVAGPLLLGRRPSPGLRAGTPVISCPHGSG